MSAPACLPPSPSAGSPTGTGCPEPRPRVWLSPDTLFCPLQVSGAGCGPPRMPSSQGPVCPRPLGVLAAFLQDSRGRGPPLPAVTISTRCTEPSALGAMHTCQSHTSPNHTFHAEHHRGTRGATSSHEGTRVSFLQLWVKRRGSLWALCRGGTHPSGRGFRPSDLVPAGWARGAG